MTDAASWMNLKNISRWKKLDRRDCIVYDSIYMTCLEKASFWKQSRLVAAWGWEWGLTVNDHEESWGDENVLKLIYGDGCTIQ